MAVKKDGQYILSHGNSEFYGVFFTLRNGKFPKVFFHLKGDELVPQTGGFVVHEKKGEPVVPLNQYYDDDEVLEDDEDDWENDQYPEDDDWEDEDENEDSPEEDTK